MSTLRNSAILRASLGLVGHALSAATRRLLARASDVRLYPELLVRLHQFVRAAVPLMETAIGVARERAAEDAVAAGLVPYLTAHAEEERHHDEWLLDDLAAAAVARADVLARIPSPAIAALVGAQYYWIRHCHPVALLGYFLALEGHPVEEPHIATLQAGSGLPDAAFRTYRLHARLDPGHSAELDDVLDRLPLTRAHLLLVGHSLTHTAAAMTRVLDEIIATLDAVA